YASEPKLAGLAKHPRPIRLDDAAERGAEYRLQALECLPFAHRAGNEASRTRMAENPPCAGIERFRDLPGIIERMLHNLKLQRRGPRCGVRPELRGIRTDGVR